MKDMKKKKKKRNKKLSLLTKVIIAFQIFIIAAFAYILIDTKPLNPNQLTYTTVVVKDIDYHPGFKSRGIVIITDEDWFYVRNHNFNNQMPNSKIIDKISIGDTLKIGYYTDSDVFGPFTSIIELRKGTESYRTLEGFNKNADIFWPAIILLIVGELCVGGLVFLNFRLGGFRS